MKKVLSLLFVCLLLTSCGAKKQEQQSQDNNQTEAVQEKGTFIKTTDDDISIYTLTDSLTYKGENLKDILKDGKITIEEIVSSYGYTTTEDQKSNMYIVEEEPAFYVMFCGNDKSNNKVYISTDFDEAFTSCD